MTDRATLEALLARVLEGTGSPRRANEALAAAGEPMSEVTYDALRKRIAELEAALRQIEADCNADYPPSTGAIKYAARAALAGGKDE